MPPLLTKGPAPVWFWSSIAGLSLVLVLISAVVGTESWPERGAMVLFCAAAPLLGFIDARERRLPDLVTLPLAAAVLVTLALAALVHDDWTRLGVAVLCGLGATLLFLVLFLVAPSQMGFGDVKLIMSIGLVLGWQGPTVTIFGLTLGLIVGLIFGVGRIMFAGADRKSHLALGPHLIIGALVLGLSTY